MNKKNTVHIVDLPKDIRGTLHERFGKVVNNLLDRNNFNVHKEAKIQFVEQHHPEERSSCFVVVNSFITAHFSIRGHN